MDELLLKRLAELEHKQWMAWSRSVADEVMPERHRRWEAMWVPYNQLSEAEKEQDRMWVWKILASLPKS
jgi:hypothetical protein